MLRTPRDADAHAVLDHPPPAGGGVLWDFELNAKLDGLVQLNGLHFCVWLWQCTVVPVDCVFVLYRCSQSTISAVEMPLDIASSESAIPNSRRLQRALSIVRADFLQVNSLCTNLFEIG